jgi:dihydroflavonol-4-reductase
VRQPTASGLAEPSHTSTDVTAQAAPGRGDVFLTGASGFVGSHVLRALVARGYRVRALVRDSTLALPPGVIAVSGDLRAPAAMLPAMRGCRYLVHTAALYSFSPRDGETISEVNIRGTAGLLEVARIAGVERCVVTSSSSALAPAGGHRPVDERTWAEPRSGLTYHGSKLLQERAALSAMTPAITVLPTAPIGPGDARPTPTGGIILDLLRGRMPATLRGGMNIVAVEDVARAHILALELGRSRERYIAGGVNLSLAEVWRLISRAAGRRARTIPLPYAVAAAAARADGLRVRITGGVPAVPIEGVHMGRLQMYSTSAKAVSELGYRPTSVVAAIERAVGWYRANGYA